MKESEQLSLRGAKGDETISKNYPLSPLAGRGLGRGVHERAIFINQHPMSLKSENSMPNITCQIIIQSPQADVFAIAQDYGVRLEWDTFSRSLAFKDGATRAAAGVRATGRAWNGVYMEVEYLIVTPPTVAAMTMIRGPFFFSTFSGSWQFKQFTESATEVIFKYHYTTPWAAPRPLIDRVIGFVLTHEINRRLRDLKHAAEQTDILDRVKDFRSLRARD